MNKGGLVAEVAKRTDRNKADVADVIDTTMAVIRESVARGDRVALVGFGTFEKRRRNKRLARNPRRPAEEVVVPARDVPSFLPGRAFRDAVQAARRSRSARARPRARVTSRRRAAGL
jgi:DNA-binding protein HU-beta